MKKIIEKVSYTFRNDYFDQKKIIENFKKELKYFRLGFYKYEKDFIKLKLNSLFKITIVSQNDKNNVNILGYTKHPSPGYNLITENKNIKDSKKADGAIIIGEAVKGVIELNTL